MEIRSPGSMAICSAGIDTSMLLLFGGQLSPVSCNSQVLYSSFGSSNLSHRSHQSGGVKGIPPEKS